MTRDWKQIDGRWTRALGERGFRVRLFQKRRGGVFFRLVWVAGRRDQKSLGTTDRKEAERRAKALLAAMRQGTAERVLPAKLTLGELTRRYREDCPAYTGYSGKQRGDVDSRLRVLSAHFGEQSDVRDLSPDDVASYAAARRAGGIKVSLRRTTRAARDRTVAEDVAVLQAMLRWAQAHRVNGLRLLDANPIVGVHVKRDPHPRRPIATWDRYVATRKAMQARAARESEDAGRWRKAELCLVLAEATGRRLSAIRHLRWEDVDWERRTIRWGAAHDKRRQESKVPLTEDLLGELRAFSVLLGSTSGWMLADDRPRTDEQPVGPLDRHSLSGMLETAERDAKLPKLEQGLWHPYRRAWATSTKEHSLTDVAATGGWQNTHTLLTCYQQPTNDAMLAVMTVRKKVRDVAVVERNSERNSEH